MSDSPDLPDDPLVAAARLVGAVLAHGGVAVRLTEVEAYGGEDDPGSHAARGPTPRTEVMFGPPLRLYCYLSYGIHVCTNVVCGPEGTAGAILLRAGRVVRGLDLARQRRPGVADERLARGPASLTRVLALGLRDTGRPIGTGVSLQLAKSEWPSSSGPRVGLRLASERPWRLWVPADPTVSSYRRHPHAV